MDSGRCDTIIAETAVHIIDIDSPGAEVFSTSGIAVIEWGPVFNCANFSSKSMQIKHQLYKYSRLIPHRSPVRNRPRAQDGVEVLWQVGVPRTTGALGCDACVSARVNK